MKTQIKTGLRVGYMFVWLLIAAAGVMAQAYEPFNYPVGNGTLNGSIGWAAGSWTTNGAPIVAPGLTYPGLTTSGNAMGGTPGSAATRLLQTPVAGNAGTSVVLQALIRSAVNGTPATQATLGNSPGGSGKTFIIGDLPMQDTNADKWGLQNDCGRFYSNVPVVAGQTAYLVARIDFNVSGTNDRMRLWVQTSSAAVPYYTLVPNIDVMCNVNTFGGVFWQTQQNQVVDEIRVDAGYCYGPPQVSNMVAWFPFDETTGTNATNLIAGSGNGTLIGGPTHPPGIVAGALNFDGINDYVQAPSTSLTNLGAGNFSIDAWIRLPTNAPNSVIAILDKRDPSTGIGYNFWLSYKRLGIQLADNSGFTNYTSVPIPSLTDNLWHHVAVTVRRNSAAGIRWYHNGASLAAQTNNPTNRQGSLTNNSPLRIGTQTASSPLSGWFKGDIDELEIFNVVLNPGEVLGLYNAGTFGKCK
jgi:hypothetical protein